MSENKNSENAKSLMEQFINLEEYIKHKNTLTIEEDIVNIKEIVFAISLKSKKVSKNWEVVQDNLSKTLRSILNNTHQNFKIIIAGHEKPDIKEINRKCVTWLPVNFPPPTNSRGFTKDKMKKRMVIGKYLKEEGFSGFFMPLDADDWLHYRFVEYLNSCSFTKAFIINKGVMSNLFRNKVWLLNDFYKHCGSCAIFYFSNKEFSKKPQKGNNVFSILTLSRHPQVVNYLKKLKIDYQIIDHPLIFRCFGHSDNNMLIKRTLWKNVTAARYKSKEEQFEKWLLNIFKV